MAVIEINFDTIEKTLSVSIDGEEQEGISAVNISNYNYGDKPESHIELVKVKQDEDNGIIERTCLYSKLKTKHTEYLVDLDKLSQAIASQIGGR